MKQKTEILPEWIGEHSPWIRLRQMSYAEKTLFIGPFKGLIF